MTLERRLEAFASLGDYLEGEMQSPGDDWLKLVDQAEIMNPWFTRQHVLLAMQSIREMLQKEALKEWVRPYSLKDEVEPRTVAVIMAGNLPLVGFHDFLSVLVAGMRFQGKLSSKDKLLLPFLASKLVEIAPELDAYIEFTEERVHDFDAIIATGSNNSARYFESYFGKYPNIIRKNRNSVAILTGEESKGDLEELAKDIYYYFGLGCRSVNKVYLPEGYKVPHFIDHMQGFEHVFDHNKYNNNYSYNRSVYLLNQIPFLDNGFTLFKEDNSFQSPISVVHYEFYKDVALVEKQLAQYKDEIQCVVQAGSGDTTRVRPGKTQFPALSDYADNVDVIQFLQKL